MWLVTLVDATLNLLNQTWKTFQVSTETLHMCVSHDNIPVRQVSVQAVFWQAGFKFMFCSFPMQTTILNWSVCYLSCLISVVCLILDNCTLPTSLSSPVESASSGSQSDLSQGPTPRDSEVFDFGVQDNCEHSVSKKKKMKTRSSSLSRFFSRGKQRKPVFKLVVKGKWQSFHVTNLPFSYWGCLNQL